MKKTNIILVIIAVILALGFSGVIGALLINRESNQETTVNTQEEVNEAAVKNARRMEAQNALKELLVELVIKSDEYIDQDTICGYIQVCDDWFAIQQGKLSDRMLSAAPDVSSLTKHITESGRLIYCTRHSEACPVDGKQ